jgi:hypothetical protein
MKKQPFMNVLPKKQTIYDCFSEFTSKALHIVIFENFVKSMTSCLSKLKVTPSFCFAFKIHDDVTTTNNHVFSSPSGNCEQAVSLEGISKETLMHAAQSKFNSAMI